MVSKIQAFGLAWHKNQSAAFEDLLITPLKPYLDIQFNSWSSASKPSTLLSNAPVILCQVRPTKELLSNSASRIIWIPMWDAVRWWRQSHWNSLPKEKVRIVAFSEQIAKRATQAGLKTLRIKYFKDPASFAERNWNKRTLLYWNRTGLLTSEFLKRLCDELKIDRLLFRASLDPSVPEKFAYQLPESFGKTTIEQIPFEEQTRENYLQKLSEANIFIAPRQYEGVGMTFLEALASGCAVFAYDAPTMNEYITSQVDGFLFDPIRGNHVHNSLMRIQARAARLKLVESPSYLQKLSLSQNWDVIRRLPLESVGDTARKNHEYGFNLWRGKLEEYAQFILEW